MDKKYISEMLSIIKNSDSNLCEIEVRDVRYNDETSNKSTLYIDALEIIGFRAVLSKSWIIENQLIFSLYDGYLEAEYSLDEGSSFKSRYEKLPITTNMDIVRKNCYRIMKIFRNAITHNLSHITADESGYKIGYANIKNQTICLEISKSAVQILYTLIIAFVEGKIEIRTEGHYEGVLLSYYKLMLSGISALEDDLTEPLIPLNDTFTELNISVRYRILNPRIMYENEVLKVKRYNPGSEMYGCDYVIKQGGKVYLIPEEIMTMTDEFLCLGRQELGEKWEIDEKLVRAF